MRAALVRYIVLIVAVSLFPSVVSAANFVWNGLSGIDANWNTGGNWNGGVAPISLASNDLIFPAGAPAASSNNISPFVLNSLTIAASNYALTGSGITLGSAAPNTGNIFVNTGAANNSAAFDIALAGGAGNSQFFTVNTSAALALSGQLSGATGSKLIKSGGGMLILSGNNSGFTGPIEIDPSGGILRIQHPSALGSTTAGTVVGTNAQLQLNNITGSVGESLVLNGSGVSGNGALLNVAGANTVSGSILLDSDTTIGATTGSMFLSGLISDSGAGHSLTIAGPGKVTIGSSNTYRGGTIINGADVFFDSSGSGTGAVTVNNGGKLSGRGSVADEVTLNSGGQVLPFPTLSGGITLDTLTWNGGGSIQAEFFMTGGSNHIFLNGPLVKGAPGTYAFNLIALTETQVGDSFDLIRSSNLDLTTFSMSDFSFVSNLPLLDGTFGIGLSPWGGTALRFTVTAVPEPLACGWLAILLPILSRRSRLSRTG